MSENSISAFFEFRLNLILISNGEVLYFIELSTRLERIRIFYEMEELELSQYHIESMEIYLRRKSNFGYHSEHYKAFIHFMRKILKQMNPNKLQWTALRKQIEQEEKLTGRKWLLEKVDQKILK